ncbi:uncharacterized protein MYCFIDRAFT_77778 [Pseudocercospora fijiensis CIRAD86]|uniref:Chitin synthesis regulation, Congo red resistance, RCR protein n=1 Tax=Pseudocercospora fijiensis (strain CIRAD86) TaxID=383855 RepID=M3ARB3_PSEFD|nr:uncharacterized protein MYCFIDRAFT_77778 [Pseudocercospora fijiensis CIRAD86]EME79977.1 hypothetical protein MYCFIDRAFT_77778 [Pseudocercospora fijiensis CIRAD86]
MAYCYRNTFGRTVCRGSRWGNWGRWVLLAVVIGVVLLIALLFACISARKRRKNGRKPFYGTGWAARGPVTHATENKPNVYAEQGGYYGTQNPSYNPPAYHGHYPPGGAAQDFSGSNAQPGMYRPPQYPPPTAGRNDGVVR